MPRLFLALHLIFLLSFTKAGAQENKGGNDKSISLAVRSLSTLHETPLKIDSLLAVSTYFVNKPGSKVADMQSATHYVYQALQLATKLHAETDVAKCYTVLSQIGRESGREAEGKRYINKSLAIFEKHPLPAAASKAYFEAASYYSIYSDTTLLKKITLYAKGLKQLEKSHPKPAALADAMKMMGDLYQFHGNYKESLPYLRRAVRLYQQAGVKTLQDVYALLGNVLVELHEMKEGIRYTLLGVNILEEKRDSSMTACQGYFNLGIAYGSIENFKNALKYLSKANTIARKNKDSTAVVITGVEVASAYRWLHQPQKALQIVAEIEKLSAAKNSRLELLMLRLKIYNQLHAYTTGAPYFDRLRVEVKKHDIASNIVQNAYIVLFEYMIATKNFAGFDSQLSRLLAMSSVKSRPIIHLNFEDLAYKADSTRGNLQAAMFHLHKATELRIAAIKINYDHQIGKLQMQFELSKKDQEIAFNAKNITLLTRKNELQKASITYQTWVRNLLIAVASLLVLMLAISYNRYQIKKRANYELEESREEINTQNESLRLLLIERDWLLKEVHHRVKNNLQIVISLLNSQLNNIKDAVAKDVIRESQHRMHSISLIHQRLYQNDGTAGINMLDYIRDLTDYLRDSFGIRDSTLIRLNVKPLMLDVSQAVPLGLILNEAITNAIKYAFTGSCPQPCLSIELNMIAGQQMELVIADNGSGLPQDFDPTVSRSLGMKLITGLTRQLHGEVKFNSQKEGLTIVIQIPLTVHRS